MDKNIEQRICFIFGIENGIPCDESLKILQKVYSESTLSLEEVWKNKVEAYLYRRSYKYYDVEDFQKTLMKTVWDNNSPDVIFLAARFLELIKMFVSNNCETVKVPIDESRPVKLWLNKEIEDLMKKRDRSYQIAVFTKSDQKLMEYRTLRNQVIYGFRSGEKSFYLNLIQNSSSQDMWKNIKSILA
ncbi:hypothetical protein HHI36_016440, partial [Cryptolaemus montrouzieri]